MNWISLLILRVGLPGICLILKPVAQYWILTVPDYSLTNPIVFNKNPVDWIARNDAFAIAPHG